jgi:hypothetical protein
LQQGGVNVRRDNRELRPVEDLTEELSLDELDEQHVVELPNREAISIVNGLLALPAGTAASAGLLASLQ